MTCKAAPGGGATAQAGGVKLLLDADRQAVALCGSSTGGGGAIATLSAAARCSCVNTSA